MKSGIWEISRTALAAEPGMKQQTFVAQPEDVTAEKLPKDVYKTVTATSEEKTAEHKQGIENAFDENLDTILACTGGGDARKTRKIIPNGSVLR